MDIDILLNTDIIELWNHFDYFEETQSIGIGLEQNPYFQKVMTKLDSNWKGYGYNNGVLLLHLSKIRSTNWNHLWMYKTKRAHAKQGYLTTGEQVGSNFLHINCQGFGVWPSKKATCSGMGTQTLSQHPHRSTDCAYDIINLILFEFNYFLYEIPCEWNIQLSDGSDEQRCPVSWLTYAELKKRNYATIVKQPKLIHINHHIKPDDVKAKYIPTEYIDQSDVILKRKLICN
ncbi:unnamed protein product [Schistosoma margrebowiei]|uniref:Uncharacterized protein n=1 Tax=Schistosoma margrebowiei TaxID=48269 RepID=A0A3P8GUQ5_9TREM|nr:unnamed protein product [Schistosoma margrebowiei]